MLYSTLQQKTIKERDAYLELIIKKGSGLVDYKSTVATGPLCDSQCRFTDRFITRLLWFFSPLSLSLSLGSPSRVTNFQLVPLQPTAIKRLEQCEHVIFFVLFLLLLQLKMRSTVNSGSHDAFARLLVTLHILQQKYKTKRRFRVENSYTQ